jgi:hypothetical protein
MDGREIRAVQCIGIHVTQDQAVVLILWSHLNNGKRTSGFEVAMAGICSSSPKYFEEIRREDADLQQSVFCEKVKSFWNPKTAKYFSII